MLCSLLGAVSIRKTVLLGMAIPMLKIRRPTGRLIFNMGIPIPGKTVFYIETGPWFLSFWMLSHQLFSPSVVRLTCSSFLSLTSSLFYSLICVFFLFDFLFKSFDFSFGSLGILFIPVVVFVCCWFVFVLLYLFFSCLVAFFQFRVFPLECFHFLSLIWRRCVWIFLQVSMVVLMTVQ